MKIKTTVHIFFQSYPWEKEPKFIVFCARIDDSEYQTYVGPQEVEVEVPDDFDPRPNKIAALEKQKQQVTADYHKSVMEINDRLSKLLALEHSA
jgi:hypothetical protein